MRIRHFIKENITIIILTVLSVCVTVFFYYLSIKEGTGGVYVQFFGGGNDGVTYWSYLQNYLNGNAFFSPNIYVDLICAIVEITGINDPIIIRLFNIIPEVGILILINKFCKLLFETNTKSGDIIRNITIIIAWLYPNNLIMFSSIYRDLWIYYLFLGSIYHAILLLKNNASKIKEVPLVAIYSLALGLFRKYAMVAFLASFVIVILNGLLKKRYKTTICLIVAILAAITLIVFYDRTLPILNMSLKSAFFYRNSFVVEYIGGSQMNFLFGNNLIQIPYMYLFSFLTNLAGPFIWQVNSLSTLLGFFGEGLPIVCAIMYFVFHNNDIDKEIVSISIFGIVWVMFIAVTNDNIGAATRLRAVSIYLLLIVVATIFARNYFKKNSV